MKHYTKTAVLLLLLLFSELCNKEQDNIPFSTETLESGISEEEPEIGITSENESFEQINESFSIPREEIVTENITLADEPEEIALSDEEMRSYRQQEAAAFKEKLLSEMNGESGVKFGVVSCFGTGMPELIVAKPLNPYGMYSMEIYQWNGEFTSCGTIEGNNIQYILGGNGISITSYTDIGSADGSLTSVSLNCYQYDNNRISLAETYNYTLQYTYDLGSMAVTGTNKKLHGNSIRLRRDRNADEG